MFCMKCGTINAETALSCARCGTPLAMQSGFPPGGDLPNESLSRGAGHVTQQAKQIPGGVPVSSLFAPIAHSPFSNEPLPQLSGPLPTVIQPAGDIIVFTPTPGISIQPSSGEANARSLEQRIPSAPLLGNIPPKSSARDLADYPTDVQVPILGTSPELTRYPGSPTILNNPLVPPGQHSNFEVFPDPGPVETASSQGDWPDDDFYRPRIPKENQVPLFQEASGLQPGRSMYGATGQPAPAMTAFEGIDAPPRSEIHPLVRPLPRWPLLAGIAVGILLLVGLVFLNPDWATGAIIAGLVGSILAFLLLIAAGVRVALGMLAETNPHRWMQIGSSACLILFLFFTAGTSFTQQTALHAMQARYLENQHNWHTAITEYQEAGEAAPTSTNLARVYNEWGEDLRSQQQYASAITKFNTVLNMYARLADQVNRARNNLVTTYLAWAASASQQQNYAGATSHYDALLTLSYCTASCHSLVLPKDATAYYYLAEQQLEKQHYSAASIAFKSLTARFATSPEARQKRIHSDYAKALWGLGQQQLHSTCADALKTYQQLAMHFSDTQQGQQAATTLQQPVQVKGRFTQHVPGAPFNPTVYLVQGLVVGIQQFQFPPLLKNAPTTQIRSDGSFTFSSVPQGTYELVWSNDGTLHFYYAFNGSQVLYTARVGPLCTYNFNEINQTIPTGN